MVDGYRKVVDDRDQLQYEESDGGGGFIVANKQPDGSWKVLARLGVSGRRTLGSFDSKRAARNRMTEFLRQQGGTSPDGAPLGDLGLGGGDMTGGADDTVVDVSEPLDVEEELFDGDDGLGL